MFKKLFLQGLVIISIVGILNTPAIAGSISGWGSKCCSQFTGRVDLLGVLTPDIKSTIVQGTAILGTVEILCVNSGVIGVFLGNAVNQIMTASTKLKGADSTGKGKATVFLPYPLVTFEDPAFCKIAGSSVIKDSAWVRDMSVRLDWFRLNDGSIIDTKNGICSVPAGTVRNADGTAPHDVPYDCSFVP